MNVLMIIDGLGAGGVERRMISLVRHLMQKPDYRIRVVVLSTNVHYDYKALDKVTFHFIKRWPKKDVRVFFRIISICRSFRPDIIHAWGSQPAMYSIPASLLLNIRMVNNMINDAPPKLPMKQWFRSKLTFPFSAAVVANSMAGLQVYHPALSKSHVIYNGFDFARLEGIPDAKTIKKKYGIDDGKRIVGMVARFEKHKDYRTFLSAAQRVLQDRKDIVFLLAGDGRLLSDFKRMVQAGNENNLIFMGRQKDVEEIISIFDIGVLATFTEGISNSVMEYMALKKPVVVTDCPGNRELVTDQATGFLVPVRNPGSLYEKILMLLENPDLRANFGMAGFQRLQQDFSIEKMANRYILLYETLSHE
jgi:glycosyltransferase involved in cell wall biosynthesis